VADALIVLPSPSVTPTVSVSPSRTPSASVSRSLPPLPPGGVSASVDATILFYGYSSIRSTDEMLSMLPSAFMSSLPSYIVRAVSAEVTSYSVKNTPTILNVSLSAKCGVVEPLLFDVSSFDIGLISAGMSVYTVGASANMTVVITRLALRSSADALGPSGFSVGKSKHDSDPNSMSLAIMIAIIGVASVVVAAVVVAIVRKVRRRDRIQPVKAHASKSGGLSPRFGDSSPMPTVHTHAVSPRVLLTGRVPMSSRAIVTALSPRSQRQDNTV
jgi:hypothetical protein